MKKLFALVLVFALLLSGCGKIEIPEVIEPAEEPSEIEGGETDEITEEFIEKIILNFGAEKEEDGTFISDKTRGFLFENIFEDASQLETKYYFFWATKKFIQKYNGDLDRFESPHGIGYSFPAEEFEEIIETYFGVAPEKLRKDGIFYCEEHNAYCSPGAIGFGAQYDIEILSHTENDKELSIRLLVGNNVNCLKVLLTENGGYRFLSYLPEETKEEEPERITSMTFKLGSEGETFELSPNDSIGEWVLTKLDVDYDSETDWTDSIEAEFSGTVELKGHIERDPMSEFAYDFVIDRSEFDRMPWLVHKDFKEFRGWFILNIPEWLENSPELDFGETLPCKITIVNYRISCAYTETADRADVIKIEPLTEEIPALYEEMILNFGAVYNHEEKLTVRKGVSLYNNREGYMDCSRMGPASYYSWIMSLTSIEDRVEAELPGFISKVYAYDAEFFENMVFKYFGTSAEYLRNSEYYYPEQGCYHVDGAPGIGDTTYIQYLFPEEKDDRVIIYFTLSDDYYGVSKHALTVKLLPEGGYNYASYLPE